MFGSFVHIPSVKASPDMLPANGDAWTENDNATYTWKFHTSYATNNTMVWTTSDVKEGSYALNVTHGKSDTGLFFRLVLDQNYDITNYDGVFLWMKITQSSDPPNYFYIHANPTDSNWDTTNRLKTPLSGDPSQNNATWTRVFVALMVYDASGTASWNSVRQLYFEITGMGSADGTEILIDNLHFTTFNVAGQTPTTDQLKIMPMAYYNMKQGQFIETYDSTNYTSMYEWQNLIDHTKSFTTLEAEVLGQTVFALTIAYEQTNFSFYLAEAKKLADWLLQFQEQNGLGRGGFHIYYEPVGWWKDMQTIYDGWILAGLSYLYGVTSNTTYKTSCDLSQNYLTGIMWNDGLNVFNNGFNNNTQTVVNGTGYSTMREGAGSVGLATYYRFVSQNGTVLNKLNAVLTTILNKASYKNDMAYATNQWEDNSYQLWGMWQAYKATSNTTYRDSFLNVTKICVGTYMKHPSLNGSATRHQSYQYHWGTTNNYQDGWGLHNTLPLFYLANEIEPQAYFVNASELSLFNHLRLTQTSEGAWQRDSSTYSDRQYYGTPAFVVLGSQLYHLNKGTDLYVPASTGRVLNISTTADTMTLTISGTGTTTTYVYCGSNGQPTTVTGATYSYDASSTVLTLTVTHSSSQEVVLDWTTIPGDIDGDGDVDRYDYGLLAQAYGTSEGDPKYIPEADLDGDGDIDRYDFGIFAGNYGKTV